MTIPKLLFIVIFSTTICHQIMAYIPMTAKDHYLSDMLIRQIVDRMGKDLLDSDEMYVDQLSSTGQLPPSSNLALMSRASKDQLENEQLDYDALLESAVGNPNPSLRDQEYLQHSSLWGHQYVSGGAGEGPHRLKPQIKTDASLPAYCNPPNPCPYGYTEEQGCMTDFENTAAFSRDYQAAQECMCDAEHMFDCPNNDQNDENRQMASDLESFLVRQFHAAGGTEHKNLVAKKFHPSKYSSSNKIQFRSLDDDESSLAENPFLQGEKLPIAAKKGINIY
ncbi:neuroendocrine protein 7B2 [Condylostylus longicornis]|uniref:neuroendocrine protein 7B2 n=1 Tax=Condylostylus longicornis TaxID=2530218 RepID=UPI00244E3135|nr:neuroendocrine protein 7B2 [Condylostylus longicornis]XP_055376606.1 neuroendocrine protein 7B2 [Condylostylus longicornis]XP_055376607.1 neuroendocrine protein 7B2 [Condylostylus longicornis]